MVHTLTVYVFLSTDGGPAGKEPSDETLRLKPDRRGLLRSRSRSSCLRAMERREWRRWEWRVVERSYLRFKISRDTGDNSVFGEYVELRRL